MAAAAAAALSLSLCLSDTAYSTSVGDLRSSVSVMHVLRSDS